MSEHPDQDPDRDLARADEQRLGELLRAVEAPAPDALHARVAELVAAAPAHRRLRAPRPRRRLGFALATGLAAAVAIVLAVTVGGSSPAPTAVRAAQLALARPQSSAPATLTAAGTAITFPDWSSRGWPATGIRRDRLDGRAVTTEFYGSYASGTIGYAIVAGRPLRYGLTMFSVHRSGGEYRMLRIAGARAVAWVQDGHTCILASRTAAPGTLLALAQAQDASATSAHASGWGMPGDAAAPV